MQLELRNDGREIKPHGNFAFPVLISPERLSAYEMESFALHWHPEIEFTLILEGDILYQVNDHTYHLKKGEGIFCNANMLHTGRKGMEPDCTYASVTVNPSLLYGYEASLLQTKYIRPVTENPLLPAVVFHHDKAWQTEILSHLETIWDLSRMPPVSFELRVLTCLYQIWILLYEHLDLSVRPTSGNIRELERLRHIITFIHNHYMEHLTLDEISASVNMCKANAAVFSGGIWISPCLIISCITGSGKAFPFCCKKKIPLLPSPCNAVFQVRLITRNFSANSWVVLPENM